MYFQKKSRPVPLQTLHCSCCVGRTDGLTVAANSLERESGVNDALMRKKLPSNSHALPKIEFYLYLGIFKDK